MKKYLIIALMLCGCNTKQTSKQVTPVTDSVGYGCFFADSHKRYKVQQQVNFNDANKTYSIYTSVFYPDDASNQLATYLSVTNFTGKLDSVCQSELKRADMLAFITIKHRKNQN